jgi:hypothetical protein
VQREGWACRCDAGRNWAENHTPHAGAFAGREAIRLYVSRTAMAAAATIGPAMGTE